MTTSEVKKLKDFVCLYRLCGKPPISDESFSFATDSADIKILQALKDFLGHSEEDVTGLSSSGQTVFVDFSISDFIDKQLSFNCEVPSKGFHESFESFVNDTPSLHKGDMPEQFYIRERDYLHGQGEVLPEVQKIDHARNLVAFLEKVITHSEEKANHVRFVLLTHDKDTHSARKQIFETNFHFSDIQELTGLEQLKQILYERDLHRNERFAILRNTLAGFLEKEPDSNNRFAFILKHFGELKEQYDLNYETYINKFAFNKFEMEVVSKSDLLLQKLNTTLNDIVTKVLVVPAGLLALKALGGSNCLTSDLMVVFAILSISLVMTLLVLHQFSNLKQIECNIQSVFRDFNKGGDNAKKIAQDNKKLLLRKKSFIHWSLWGFIAIVWLPCLLCLAYLFKEYSFDTIWTELKELFCSFIVRCSECMNKETP